MPEKIHLKKATRIEGNADIRIEIENGRVVGANFMVHDFRGFESFMRGRRIEFVPHMISRICGLCSCSQQIASLRAIEDAIGIVAPEHVQQLRDVLILAERVASHALSYFYLSLPDRLGVSGGIFQIMKDHPGIADGAMSLRRYGQEIIRHIGGRSVHPTALGIGRFLNYPDESTLRKVAETAEAVRARAADLISVSCDRVARQETRMPFPDDLPVNHLLWVDAAGGKGRFQILDRDGKVTRTFTGEGFGENITELRVDWSFAKLPFIRDLGFPDGIMMTGPLSRALSADGVLTRGETADLSLARLLKGRAVASLESLDAYRLLELHQAACDVLERIGSGVAGADPEAVPLDRSGSGYGVVEAPRGTLVHHYAIDRGRIERMRLLVATQFNNAYINLFLKDISSRHVTGEGLTPEGEELVARCVRTLDPCLSCATH